MHVAWILIGAVFGAMALELGGAALGAGLGWLLGRVLQLQRELKALKSELQAVQALTAQRTVGAATAPSAPPAPQAQPVAVTPQPSAVPSPPPPAVTPATSQALEPATATTPAAPPAPVPPPATAATPAAPRVPATQAPVKPPEPATPSLVQRLREALFGGNTVVKAGVGILFIGLAFLAKYTTEHVHVPIELRLAGIGVVSLVLLALGWRLRHTRAAYAQVLQGGAIATLYLTLFAAFRFYSLATPGAAFAAMSVVAGLAAALAVLQNARALAVIGTLGGYATPLLISTGSGNHVALFGWYLVLTVAVATIAWFRTWRVLNLIAFYACFGVATLWGALSYSEPDYPSAQAFLIVFFGVFLALLLLPGRRAADATAIRAAAAPGWGTDRWLNGTLLFGLPTIVFALQHGMVREMPYGTAVSALVLAAVYIGVAVVLRGRVAMALAFEGCLAVGTVFLTLVIPFALDGRSTAGAWALEGAGLVWLGWRQHRRLARALGYLLIVLAGGLLWHAIDNQPPPSTWLNGTMLAGLMLVAGAWLAAWTVSRSAPAPLTTAQEPSFSERLAEPLLVGWALLAALAVLVTHVGAIGTDSQRVATLIAGLAVLAGLHTLLADRLRWRGMAWPVLGLAPVLLLLASVAAMEGHAPWTHGGWWAWPVALGTLGWAMQRAAPHWPARGQNTTHVLGVLLLATLGATAAQHLLAHLTVPVVDGAVQHADTAWPWLAWLAVPALLLWGLTRPASQHLWPVRLAPAAYAHAAGACLGIMGLAGVLLGNLVSNGSPAPLPYLLLLNPLDVGVALALWALGVWALGAPAATPQGRWRPGRQAAWVVLGAVGFVWLNAMLVRGFHHWADVPFRIHAWTGSLPVQTGLTLLWTATALPLMWWGARRVQRGVWMAGAALLAAVVLKLLLVDLSGSGTVTRIVSFIGAGVLMLVIGYVAPLPTRQVGGAAKEGLGDVSR